MTCVVGIAEAGRVHLAADSMMCEASGMAGTIVEPKVFIAAHMQWGIAGLAAWAQTVRYMLRVRKRQPRENLSKYLHTEVRPALQNLWEQNHEDESRGPMVLGVRGRLFELDETFTAFETRGYHSIGSGAEIALGSLHTSQGAPIGDRLRMALEAATEYRVDVRGPWVFL